MQELFQIDKSKKRCVESRKVRKLTEKTVVNRSRRMAKNSRGTENENTDSDRKI